MFVPQTQAASQEALEQIKAANEASLRSQLEQRIRDLDGELSRLRSSQQDSLSQRDSTKTELERYRELYAEELRLRKSLAGKLERSGWVLRPGVWLCVLLFFTFVMLHYAVALSLVGLVGSRVCRVWAGPMRGWRRPTPGC